MKENTIDQILGRSESLFKSDFEKISEIKKDELQKSTFVVVGGAGSIGSSVVKLLVRLKAKKIQVIDISENNLVELIRTEGCVSWVLRVCNKCVCIELDQSRPIPRS